MTVKKSISWTEDQIKAIDFPYNRSAVVTAAAGSGKTALLVERVVRLIRGNDENPPIEADKFAILTFTRNSADEFRSRMSQAIEEASRPGANERIPREQLIRFRSAVVSTINSFCLGILKENADAFGLPVNFTVAEENKAALMLEDALEVTMEYFYSEEFSDAYGSDARELLSKTFSYKNDEALREAVVSIHEKISSLADPEGWLEGCAENYSSRENAGRAFVKPLMIKAGRMISAAEALAEEYRGFIRGLDCGAELKESFIPVMESDIGIIEDWRVKYELMLKEEFNLDNFGKFADSLCLPKLKTLRLAVSKPDEGTKAEYKSIKENVDVYRRELKKSLSDIKEFITVDESGIDEELRQQHKTVSALITLVKRLEIEFSLLKRKAGCVDFADCERLLLNRLKSEEGKDLRAALSDRFRCIIVDEFQDTNDIQFEIFRLISRDGGNLFFVGDVKQSIYAFRGGNPRIMSALCRGEHGFSALPLNKNFRSRNEIIDSVNTVFSGLMTEKYGDVDYEKGNKLVYGSEYPDAAEKELYSTEIFLLDYSESRDEFTGDFTASVAEARFTADKIRRMVNDRFPVKKSVSETRPCEYGDFCVLLRNSIHAEEYKTELEKLGIPVSMKGAGGYLDTEEISLILNFLKIIDNPMSDEQLLNVLMSPLYSFSAEEIAEVRLGIIGFGDTEGYDMNCLYDSFANKALYTCVKQCSEPSSPERLSVPSAKAGEQITLFDSSFGAAELLTNLREKGLDRKEGYPKCVKFIKDFTEFRRFAANNSIERLIRKIYDDTDLYAVFSTYERGNRKVANIRLLLKYASDFENSGGGALSDFLRYSEAARNGRIGFSEAIVPKDAANAVRIMTFHASKGLEMPIVILGGLGGSFSGKDSAGTMVFNRSSGIGLQRIYIDKRYSADNMGYNAAAAEQKQDQIGEELRLLYVAMTRAKEKLIMIGRGKAENITRLTKRKFSPELAFNANNAMEWILCSVLRYCKENYGDNFGLSLRYLRLSVSSSPLPEPETEKTLEIWDGSEPDEEVAALISKGVLAEYNYERLTRMRSRYTVTEIAHLAEKRDVTNEIYLTRPTFGKEKITGASTGNAYHHIMEFIRIENLNKGGDLNSAIKREIAELANSGKIEREEAALVNADNIAAFFVSVLGRRLLSSPKFEREYPVFAEVPACDIYVSEDGDDTETIVQGRVDMLFYEKDRIVVVDYKSDTKENLEKELPAYAKQLKIYRRVLPEMTGVENIEIYIYSFSRREIWNVDEIDLCGVV